jgi:hypothetical protein
MEVNYLSQPGKEGGLNEDSYVIRENERIFGVFDGATSFNKFVKEDGVTGGKIASAIAAQCFQSDAQDLYTAYQNANRKLQEEMEGAGVDTTDKLNLWCTSIAAISIFEDVIEWLTLSDSLIIVIYQDNTWELLPKEDYSQDRWWLIQYQELVRMRKYNMERLKKLIVPLVEVNRILGNETYGHLSGEESSSRFIRKGSISREHVTRVLVFTDGLIPPNPDPSKQDVFDKWMEVYFQDGIEGIYSYVRELELSDPQLTKYPRWKLHDDATIIEVKF